MPKKRIKIERWNCDPLEVNSDLVSEAIIQDICVMGYNDGRVEYCTDIRRDECCRLQECSKDICEDEDDEEELSEQEEKELRKQKFLKCRKIKIVVSEIEED